MQCMKTGLRFSVSGLGYETFHGDMFYSNTTGGCLIRGIAYKTSEQTPDMLLIPNGDAYMVMSMTSDLTAQLTKYYPDLDMTKVFILISDTRFF